MKLYRQGLLVGSNPNNVNDVEGRRVDIPAYYETNYYPNYGLINYTKICSLDCSSTCNELTTHTEC